MRLFEGTQFDIPPKCDRCGQLEADCHCPPLVVTAAPESQTAKIAVEKRNRGKLATVIRGLIDDAALPPLLTALKQHCGAGGSCKDGIIEIQGSHQAAVAEHLRSLGYRVKG